jgi:sporulation-control protein
LRDRVKELEFIAAIEEVQIRLLPELDLPSFGREVEIKQEIVLSNEVLSDVSRLADFLRDVMEEMVNNPEAYLHTRHSFGYGHHHHSGFGGAMGGLVAGLLGGMVISEIMDEIMGDDEEEAETASGEEEEDGGFFDDFFGGEDD